MECLVQALLSYSAGRGSQAGRRRCAAARVGGWPTHEAACAFAAAGAAGGWCSCGRLRRRAADPIWYASQAGPSYQNASAADQMFMFRPPWAQ